MLINIKKIGLFFLLALLPIVLESSADHAIYISVIEVNHDDQTVRIKTFSDDLINGLKSKNPDIALSTDPCSIQSSMESYVADNLQLFINGEMTALTLTDCDIESDTHWMTFEYHSKLTLDKLRIETRWLTDLFLDQQNIIKITVGKQRSHSRLNANETSFEMVL